MSKTTNTKGKNMSNQYSPYFAALSDLALKVKFNELYRGVSNFHKGGTRQVREAASACRWELKARKIELPESSSMQQDLFKVEA